MARRTLFVDRQIKPMSTPSLDITTLQGGSRHLLLFGHKKMLKFAGLGETGELQTLFAVQSASVVT